MTGTSPCAIKRLQRPQKAFSQRGMPDIGEKYRRRLWWKDTEKLNIFLRDSLICVAK